MSSESCCFIKVLGGLHLALSTLSWSRILQVPQGPDSALPFQAQCPAALHTLEDGAELGTTLPHL